MQAEKRSKSHFRRNCEVIAFKSHDNGNNCIDIALVSYQRCAGSLYSSVYNHIWIATSSVRYCFLIAVIAAMTWSTFNVTNRSSHIGLTFDKSSLPAIEQ